MDNTFTLSLLKKNAERMRLNFLRSPVRLLIVLVVLIFVVEASIMALLPLFPNLSPMLAVFLDSMLLVIFLFPCLTFLVFRPLVHHINERRQSEEALRESEKDLRNLSSQLLSAQETERRRISRELHDELGQALSLIKLRVKGIEKNLRKGKGAVEEDCASVLQYLDQVIEDVRRLSRDLSPSILEDLGLTASLRWLFNNFSSVVNKQATLDIEDIDHLFSRDAQIMIYRTLQEVLTNIQKHAGAENISVSVRKAGGGVSFVVDDDGRGFNVSQALKRDSRARGLGLATIAERIRMLGGSLEIHSWEGKGTRITFTVPAEKETPA